MSDETEVKTNDNPAQDVEDVTPLEVTIKKEKKEFDVYDSQDDKEYENIDVTEEQIKEYEDGKITRN